MRRLLILAVCLFSACCIRAVSVAWNVPHSIYEWTDSVTDMTLIFSTTNATSYDQVVSATGGAVEGVSSVIPSDSSNAIYEAWTPATEQTPVMGAKYAHINIDAGNQSGYFYLVLKKDEKTFTVAKSSQYVPAESYDGSQGFYDNVIVGPNHEVPDFTEFGDLSYLGGTWPAASTPEPSVFALLALGVAGLAMRRRV